MGNRYMNSDPASQVRLPAALPAVKVLVVLFYVVGLTGLLVPSSRPFFLSPFPYFLLLNAVVLGIYHSGTFHPVTLVIFLLIFLSGFLIEAAGVNTGLVFGDYYYGNSLGFKIFDTPLVIGLNWLMLMYLLSGVVERTRLPNLFQVVIIAFLMLIYDLVLEQVAPKTDMWHWTIGHAPVQNYVAWFVISILFSGTLKMGGIRVSNPLSMLVISCQFLFFLILLLFLP